MTALAACACAAALAIAAAPQSGAGAPPSRAPAVPPPVSAPPMTDTKPPASSAPPQQLSAAQYAQRLTELVQAADLRRWHDVLTQEPHVAGTPGDARQIERLRQAFDSMSIPVRVEGFRPYLCRPVAASLEIVEGGEAGSAATGDSGAAAPRKGVLSLNINEKNLAEDPATAHPDLTFGWNAYSGDGDVTAEVVYANYGTREDFEKLKALGVDVRGKIVLARYGRNFRGYKARFAEQAGAAGLIIYTDPADAGFTKGGTWPGGGGWANDCCIQRGTLNTLPYPGDPGTPGVYSADNVLRDDPSRLDLPRIPVQPIGYAAAGAILSRMKGDAVPEGWQGGLTLPYRLTGGGALKVRLMVKQERFIGTSANVIAMVQGWRRPNEAIVIGCHHDAWGYGAADPCAGTICLLEAARCVAELTKQGIWPERSIIFAAWGAEEFGIIGSTEWVEGHDQEMTNRVVAYVNLDMAAMGPNLSIALTPELAGAARDAAGMVPAARNHGTTALAAMMADHKESPLFGTLGGGSDHVGFVCRLVVPSIAISAGGAEGTSYHSNYDTTAWYRATVGEDYEPAILVTRTTLAFTALMADQRVLPYQYGEIGRQALAALDDLQKLAANDAEKAAVESLRTPLVALRAQGELVDAALAQGRELDPQSDIRVASGMKKFVKAFFDAAGLPDRPWYRNLWVATDDSNSYAPCVLPLVREALQQHDAKRLEEGVARTAEAIQRATLAADLMLLGLRSPGAVPEQGRQ